MRGFGATLAANTSDQLTIDISLALQPFTASTNTPDNPTPDNPTPETTPNTPNAE
jgi:hypothetical protein